MDIKIEWTSDISTDCETCGMSSAYGADVYFDGDLVLELKPVAHCTGGTSFTEEEVYEEVFKLLGHNLRTDWE
jgi:hypothetical protein